MYIVKTLYHLCVPVDPGIRMSVVMQLLNIIRRTEEIEINLVDKAEIQQRLLNIAVAYLTDNNYQVVYLQLNLFSTKLDRQPQNFILTGFCVNSTHIICMHTSSECSDLTNGFHVKRCFVLSNFMLTRFDCTVW